MSKELVVSSTPHQTRLALLENDRLVEIYVERESHQGLAGSIHNGRVTRVLPGMQSAFVDIGLDRDAFLYVSDFFEGLDEYEATPDDKEAPGDKKARPAPADAELSSGTDSSASRSRRERRGHRGRRGRPARRRESGGGFPESKYAQVGEDGAGLPKTGAPELAVTGSPVIEEAESPDPLPVAESVAEFEQDFAVLPGESLAKYADTGESPAAEADNDPRRGGISAESQEQQAASAEPDISDPVEGDPAEDHPPLDADQASADPLTFGSGVADGGCAGEAVAAAPPTEPAQEIGAAAAPEHSDADSPRAESASRQDEPEPVTDDASRLAEEASFDPQEEAPENSVELPETSSAAEDGVEALAEAVDDALSEQSGESVGPGDEDGQAVEHPVDAGAAPSGDSGEASHSAPGLPLPEAGESTKPEAARVRERSGSARSLRRRGRRGRRRPDRHREETASVETPTEQPPAASSSSDGTAPAASISISDMLSKGNEILVQIAKEPLGKKGARITSHIALPGRFLVYMPTVDHVGVSRKIDSFDERRRLRAIVKEHRTGMPGGFIVRTAGEGIKEEQIRGDMLFLYNLWLDIRQKAESRSGVGLVHQDLDIVERVLRDQLDEDFKTIWVDHEEEYERILRFVERFQPKLLSRVKLYTRPRPVFDEFNVTKDIERALRPKVWLKSGGYIVINHTEALVAIDVNTGKYVGKSDRLEDTIVNTNLEAASEIVRQMRLRDLGGIIVVDFIDMEDRKNRVAVLQALEAALHQDPAPSKSLPFNEFGLVAITRKRVKQSLERTLCSPCSVCGGSGLLKSIESVIYEIMDEARGMGPDMEPQKDVTLRVNPEVARTLKSRKNRYLQEIEELLKSHVLVRSDLSLQREHFDIN